MQGQTYFNPLINSSIKGYARSMLYYKSYITHPNYTNSKAIVDFRIKVIQHYEHHGLDSTLDAFDLSRATLFNWLAMLRRGKGKLESLAPTTTAPHTKRRRFAYPFHTEQIIRLRNERPKIGKAKLKALLDKLCREMNHPTISESTIGRLIGDLKKSGRLTQHTKMSLNGRTGKLSETKHRPKIKKQRRGSYTPKVPGDLVQIDCVEKFIMGVRRYVISGIDYKSSFSYSYAYKTLTSANARDFFLKFQKVAPFNILRAQTDNGHEFYRAFLAELDYQKLIHFWNYPRHPKSNGKIERYNRTIQEEFIDYHLDELRDDINLFNHLLTDWLIYYNTERPHAAHIEKVPGRKTGIQMPPMKACVYMLGLGVLESNMLWTQTET